MINKVEAGKWSDGIDKLCYNNIVTSLKNSISPWWQIKHYNQILFICIHIMFLIFCALMIKLCVDSNSKNVWERERSISDYWEKVTMGKKDSSLRYKTGGEKFSIQEQQQTKKQRMVIMGEFMLNYHSNESLIDIFWCTQFSIFHSKLFFVKIVNLHSFNSSTEINTVIIFYYNNEMLNRGFKCSVLYINTSPLWNIAAPKATNTCNNISS